MSYSVQWTRGTKIKGNSHPCRKHGPCREERGKQMWKSKNTERCLVNGSKWATWDVFIGNAKGNHDRFGDELVSFSLISSSTSHLSCMFPFPKGAAINWQNHKKPLGRCQFQVFLYPLSVRLRAAVVETDCAIVRKNIPTWENAQDCNPNTHCDSAPPELSKGGWMGGGDWGVVPSFVFSVSLSFYPFLASEDTGRV